MPTISSLLGDLQIKSETIVNNHLSKYDEYIVKNPTSTKEFFFHSVYPILNEQLSSVMTNTFHEAIIYDLSPNEGSIKLIIGVQKIKLDSIQDFLDKLTKKI
jgi:hypothetical protein